MKENVLTVLKIVTSIAIIALIVILIILLLRGCGGMGNGKGVSNDENDLASTLPTDYGTQKKDLATSEENKGNLGNEKFLNVIVKIEEDKVFIDNHEFNNSEELKSYIEEIYQDGKTFELVENNSILSVHEWVREVFKDLDIPLVLTDD